MVSLKNTFFLDFLTYQIAESCESEEQEKQKVKCPKHYKGYFRAPTATNNMTKMWCLRVVTVNVSVSEAAAQEACNREGSVLSTFACYDEQKHIVSE